MRFVTKPLVSRFFDYMRLIHNFQNAKNMRNIASNAESVYISIDFAEKYKNGLSGKYTFHSMEDDTSGCFPTYRYIREPVPVPGYATDMKFFLCRKKDYWSIDFEAVKSGRQSRLTIHSEIFKKTTAGNLCLRVYVTFRCMM